MKKALLLLVILNTFSVFIFAQKKGQAIIDSLITELPKAKEETTKVDILAYLCKEYEAISDFTKGLAYGNKGLILSQKINYKKGEAECYNYIGIIYNDQSDYLKALDYYFRSLKIEEALSNKHKMAEIYTNIGLVYHYEQDYNKALDYYFKSLK